MKSTKACLHDLNFNDGAQSRTFLKILSRNFFHGCTFSSSFITVTDIKMSAMASQIISLTIVNWTVYSGADKRKHQSSASLAFVWGIHRWPVNSPHKLPVTRKMFPFEDVIMLHLSPPSGWSWEFLEDWGPFCNLAFTGLVMVCVEFWTFEAGVILSGKCMYGHLTQGSLYLVSVCMGIWGRGHYIW